MSIKIQPTSSAQSATEPLSVRIMALLNKDISIGGKGLSIKSKEQLYSGMETLLSAGLDLRSSIELLAEGRAKKKEQALLTQLAETLVKGASLSEAMFESGQFSDYEVFSIRIGEETGQLTKVCRELADFYAKGMLYRRQLISALSYPAFVTSFALGAVYFMLNYLVPVFKGFFGRMNGDLPQLTKNVIAVSDALGRWSTPILLFLAGIIALLYWQRRQPMLRRISAKLLIHLPLFGAVVKGIYLARFCQSMNLLLSSRVPLLNAASLVRQMVGFYPLEEALVQAEKDLVAGISLHATLSKQSFFPPQFLALIKVGETSGQLGAMFARLATQYSDEAGQRTAVLGTLIEPLLIVFIGLLVGLILVAMYLPLFNMGGMLHH